MNKHQLPAYLKIGLSSCQWLLVTGSLTFSMEALADTQNTALPPEPTAYPESRQMADQGANESISPVIRHAKQMNEKRREAREALEHEAIPVGMEGSTLAAPNLPVTTQPTAPSKITAHKINSQEDALHTLASALAASPKEGNQTQAILLAAADRGDYLPAISWSLAQKYWGLAEILVANNPGRTPPWVRLSLALHKKDLSTIQTLLDHPADLPPKEMFQAEEDLGRPRQAQALAIKALQVNPFDRELRRMYVDSLAHTASYAGIKGSWQSFNGLQLYGPELNARIHASPFWGIQIQSQNLWQHADSGTQLIDPPRLQNRTDLGIFWQHRRWQGDLSVGEYRGLQNNWTSKLAASWQMTSSTSLSTRLAYHSQTFQSPALAVAGMANRAEVQLAQTFNAWTANAALGWNQYLGQDGIQQGTDTYGELSAFWRSNLGPWEFHVGPFADYHALQRRAAPKGVIAQVLSTDARNMDSILPGSYADYGVRLQWGALEQNLHPGWMPNLQLSVYDNSRFGFQYQLNAGISTAVLGPDRLSLDFSQGQGGNGLALNQRIFALNYRFYF
ncbi:hypothetical protein A6M27_14765 [Acidithiobacillus thiooxidans]|uniref:PelB C-terminal domain-containing protein n=1 Tax=Acidithiobacillus thiooxidans TaxID=930 RepID=A0A1C2JBQ0_ACITH|nr:hypothetical protein [Acidithiobacillus thiooxidans]OCX69201.1 hypothetical protein A6P07_16915 [Acidithiobacillus thiooxidans]OCX79977.1 hypothetical protein A6O24_00505 [Acidithiobacillus thiooxidans]OCX85625.1 hypothetical protein A6M27_14765 [Acidithiobacillus thiooxidans]OCX85744.1 hypothetical protein A6O26_00595 [Acidithiobacillus thiooxidans]OFC48751.1 hypothetical protein BAE47_06675 [Acidithiobacillus thiooxidans]